MTLKLIRRDWLKQPDGLYTILEVPIFGVYKDPTGKRGQAGPKELVKTIENFEKDRDERYRYPRLHQEHHSPFNKHQRGLGFLDNLRIKGELIFADLVNLTLETLERIKKLELPYLSAEYDDKQCKIGSLAMLSTENSFFPLPILALNEKPLELAPFQAKMFSVSWNDRNERLLKFSEKKNMPDDIKPEGETKENPEETTVEQTVESQSEEMSLLKEIAAGIKALQEAITGGAFQKDLDSFKDKEKKDEPVSSESVPFSGEIQKQFSAMSNMISALTKEIAELKDQNSLSAQERELKAFCEETPGLEFGQQLEMLKQFSSEKDRAVYIGGLKTMAVKYPNTITPVTEFASHFKATPNDEILKEYMDNPRELGFAREAMKKYREIIGFHDERVAKQFAAINPDIKKFVKNCVEMEALQPGFIDKLTI